MPGLAQQIETRLADAMAAADDASTPVSVVVNKALRVARLRSDWGAVIWLLMETRGAKDKQAKERAGREVGPHLTLEEMTRFWKDATEAYISERALTMQSEAIMPTSVAEAEGISAALREQAAHLQPASGLEGFMLRDESHDMAKTRAQFLTTAADNDAMLARVRTRVADYLSQVERQIAFGQVNADIWERNRAFVDAELAKVAPDALEQFQAAYRRQAENESEARSHALTSCRRVLKSLADALYPATDALVPGADGKSRPMTDDRFVSRLIQFVTDAAPGKTGQVMTAEIQDFGTRLAALNELSSKGVHSKVTQAEVDLSLIRTYLIAGDLLRLREGSSAALQPPAAFAS
jgi:hypothetical protein